MPLTKALIINTDAVIPIPIPVQFNPPEYQLQKSNQFAEVGIPGLGSSLLQFVRGSAQTLTLELFFDTTDSLIPDVRVLTELLVGLTSLNPETHAPPRLLFLWGSLVFPCVLESVAQKFEQFNTLGLPQRARLNVTLKGFDLLADLLAKIPLLSADRTKHVVFTSGMMLQQVAAREYNDPRQWRPIAEANDIDNPLRISAGTELKIPTLN